MGLKHSIACAIQFNYIKMRLIFKREEKWLNVNETENVPENENARK